MDEIEMLSWLFVLAALMMPVILLAQKRLVNALIACCLSAILMALFYVTVTRTAVTVESECRKPLIGMSVNK